MAISFTNIPINLRSRGFYAEVDASKAATGQIGLARSLVFGQKVASGTGVANIPFKVTSPGAADTAGGFGSMFARMCAAYMASDPLGDLWGVVVDDSAGAQATAQIVFGGTATAAGTIMLYVGGQLLNRDAATRGIPVAISDTGTTVGASIQAALGLNEAAAVTLKSPYICTASNAAGTVTFTVRHKGEGGNEVDLRLNHFGTEGGERLPSGITAGVTQITCSGGTIPPVLTTAIANLGDVSYNDIIWPWTDTTSLNAIQVEMNDTLTGRWGPLRQCYGRVYSAKLQAYAGAATWGDARNDQHMCIPSIEKDPFPPWEIAAAAGGTAAQSLRIDPARTVQTLSLPGILCPQAADAWTKIERNTLLYHRLAQLETINGQLCIDRLITTYGASPSGSPDNSMLDVETMATLQYLIQDTAARIQTKYGRHKLADDGTQFGPGQAIVTPSVIKGELVAAYAEYEERGLVENADVFRRYLIVERNGTDPDRLDILYPPDIINNCRVFALLAQFRLQYSAAEKAA